MSCIATAITEEKSNFSLTTGGVDEESVIVSLPYKRYLRFQTQLECKSTQILYAKKN
jgi:hypothetical protein